MKISLNWLRDFIDISNTDLDNDMYESAEKQYLQNDHKKSILSFKKYLQNFPNGLHKINANFYLAQSYYADGLEANSVTNYEYVISKSRNEFTEQALARLAEIHIKSNDNNNDLLRKRKHNEIMQMKQLKKFTGYDLSECRYNFLIDKLLNY